MIKSWRSVDLLSAQSIVACKSLGIAPSFQMEYLLIYYELVLSRCDPTDRKHGTSYKLLKQNSNRLRVSSF